uniref:Uncharacterized protein n=1 Tax=viral metagenome TaxID=1070528 RepID=A0A6H1Z9H7_9ZZZZ
MKKLRASQVKLKGWVYIPEDKCEEELTFRGIDWALTVWDLDNELRGKLKYGHKFKNADESLLWVRELLRDILENRNLSLETII